MSSYYVGPILGDIPPSAIQAPITPSDLTTAYPQFANLPTATIQTAIDFAQTFFDAARWGERFRQGQLLYVAHQLTLSALAAANNGAGAVVDDVLQKRAGGVSKGRDGAIAMATMTNPLLRTYYGQEYLRLRRIVGMGAIAL